MFNEDYNNPEIKNPKPQEPLTPPQPDIPDSPPPIDEERNPKNPKPIEGEEPQDPSKQTPILEDVPNPNTNNNPGDNWSQNHPIRPDID